MEGKKKVRLNLASDVPYRRQYDGQLATLNTGVVGASGKTLAVDLIQGGRLFLTPDEYDTDI
jgi:hypothetical protein